MTARALVALLAALAACGRPTSAPPAPEVARPVATATEVPAAPSSAVDAAAPTDALLPGIPLPKSPTAGPLRVDGYPRHVEMVNSDPATPFGFTRDGSQFVYCTFDVCCADDVSRCVLTGPKGEVTTLENPTAYGFLEGPAKAAASKRTNAALRAFTRDEGLLSLGPQGETGRLPPAVTGGWAFGGDMTLVVRTIAPTEGKGDDDVGHVPGSVKIGARLEGEREVFVVFPRPDFCGRFPQACYDAYLNGLALSPDGSELGFLVAVRNPSHGSSFAAVRMRASTFAARVLNDTGMLHHAKKDFARAAELFTRAVYAAPDEERFAYNLACALARLGDARAEGALAHAVARGGDAVRGRARKDADFEGVQRDAWFARALR